MMFRKPPAFWAQENSLWSHLLTPVSFLVRRGASLLSALQQPYHASVPVVCVGNVTVGGTGKTPLVITLAERLTQQGWTPHILSRGYGRSSTMHLQVDASHTPDAVGDEALLLAKVAPTWVGARREETAQQAIQQGATVLLMDDGYQNLRLHKDLHLLVWDQSQPLPNRRTLPAGPLREPLARAFQRADAFFVYGREGGRASLPFPPSKPIFEIERTPTGSLSSFTADPEKPYLAFAGIGRPEQFFQSLRDHRIRVVQTVSFPDHHRYTDADIAWLLSQSHSLRGGLITTAKDFVKFSLEVRSFIQVFSITATLMEEKKCMSWLVRRLQECQR